MKRLLMPAAIHVVAALPVDAALSIAGRFGADVLVKLYRAGTDDQAVDPMSWGLSGHASREDVSLDDVARARAVLETRIAASAGAEHGTRLQVDPDPIGSWRELGMAARISDLSIVSREALAGNAVSVMEQLLFMSGRPMLVSPGGWDRPVGEVVAIAWNRSSETARLIGLAINLLRSAREVWVIALDDWYVEGPDGPAVTAYLRDTGVNARLHQVARSRGEFGDRILHEASRLGADLLLKGAYTQSRITQVFFGGATRDILHEAGLPVMFAH